MPLLQTTELPLSRELICGRRLSLVGLDLCVVLFADERGGARQASLDEVCALGHPIHLRIPDVPSESADDVPDLRNHWWKQPRNRKRRGW